ncbi:fluoride efflux transporter FluC [Lacticaseibacillus absianus]|uniref:fluoride efflux transporter FluC n=1 Tax=Lacticaseibacillus absianus TaxID=2729623 RepID=UPI0015CDDAC7|nr:CrcB family protein [Lacticaseibacillus absianus]
MIGWIALGAGCGATLRYLTTQWSKQRWPGRPVATILVNLSGALVAGMLASLPSTGWRRSLLVTGLCGGLTTFSTMMVDADILAATSRWRAVGYVLGTTVAGLLAVLVGAWLVGG